MKEKGAPRSLLVETGLNYSISAVLPVLVSFVAALIFSAALGKGYTESEVYKYCQYLLPQLCFCGACLFFFRRNRSMVREVYRPCKWYFFLLAALLAFGLLSLTELNSVFLKAIGYKPEDHLPDVTGWNLLPAMLVIAVLPAFFEESVFRGIQIGGMRVSEWGTVSVLFLSGALFSLFHGSPAQTIYQFICGVVYALLAVRSGSVFPTMLAHFLNNGVILALTSAGYEEIPAAAKLPLYLTAGVVLVAVLIYLAVAEKKGNELIRNGMEGGKKYFLAAAAGIAVCAVEWITALVTGLS